MTIQSNVPELILRLQAVAKDAHPDSEKMRKAFTQIGIRLVGQTILNVRRNRLIDTGRLINSIRYEFYKDGDVNGIKIGSFGVPYASVHEFGYHGNVNVRAHQRLVTKVFGNTVSPHRVEVGTHTRKMNIPARPYLKPAVTKHSNFIIETLRGVLTDG